MNCAHVDISALVARERSLAYIGGMQRFWRLRYPIAYPVSTISVAPVPSLPASTGGPLLHALKQVFR